MRVLGTSLGVWRLQLGQRVREVLWGLCLLSEVPSTQEHILKGKTLFGHVKARENFQKKATEIRRDAERQRRGRLTGPS